MTNARYHGRITQWFDDRGYGFITASGGPKQIFAHVSAFTRRGVRPKIGDVVTFMLDRDPQGRLRAMAIQSAGGTASHADSGRRPWWIAVLVVGIVAGLAAGQKAPWWVVVLYGALSFASWLTYAWDKAQAEVRGQRIAENTLHLMALFGGWPGALVGQIQFRHKTRKTSFRIVFWLTVIANVVALTWMVSEGAFPFSVGDVLGVVSVRAR